MSDIESIYAYDNSAELTRDAIRWTTYPSDGNILKIGANSNLETAAVDALLGSDKIQNITCLELTEIYVSLEHFEKLLMIPNLVELNISGGSSSDWNGPDYTYPTLSDGHYKILTTSTYATKLQRITFNRESISDETKAEIRRTLPNLVSFDVF